MNIEFRNCNNIDFASISLDKDKLNIKYAPNGSGKSTIAKALLYNAEKNPNRLSDLMPFKLKKVNPENKQPEVNGAEGLRSILCFNEEYVSQFVFTPDELLSNSFDILIKTEKYKTLELEIENLIRQTKQIFSDNKELESLIANLNEMRSAFKLTDSGLSKASVGIKGLSLGNKIQHIPVGLEPYAPFIRCSDSVSWIDWQTKGYIYSELSQNCPYCTSHAADKKEQIQQVGKEYDKNTIKHLVNIIGVIEKLGDYCSRDTQDTLAKIKNLNGGLEQEHKNFLRELVIKIEDFTGKLEKVRTLSAFQFKEGDKVSQKLPDFKLDLQLYSELQSVRMQEAIFPINKSIDEIILQAGQLEGKINRQRDEIKKNIERHQNNINEFLTTAGYDYQVEIVGQGDKSQLKLRHIDYEEYLRGGSQHLSFGERNAFALVLFMYECLSKNPDLIILDDPISSFDKNKKYAILQMLFRRNSNECLLKRTVLLLTHDEEPIIDTTRAVSREFRNQTSAAFLRFSAGRIQELKIERNDIKTFAQICNSVLDSDRDIIIKLIYLRRLLEITDTMGDGYQVLSNIFKKREAPIDLRERGAEDGNDPQMDADKFSKGCLEVEKRVPGFSYMDILNRVKNTDSLKSLYCASSNGYEKLQIFRLLSPEIGNSVIRKFVNETYHIENEFVCQLDPTKFDTIPEYVVSKCTQLL